jgi:hypothetical protein
VASSVRNLARSRCLALGSVLRHDGRRFRLPMTDPVADAEPRLVPAKSWPDLLFHVLAHVAGTAALASSVYDPAYVRFVERSLGSAHERPLGEDADVLGRVLGSHEALARVQLLAWLFDTVEQASASAEADLGALAASDVAEPSLRAPLAAEGPSVELLRCAAELERGAFERLPQALCDRAMLGRALGDAVRIAPGLRGTRIMPVRSLRLRGRVRGADIWVGAPCADPGPDRHHVIWQASHEATVREVGLVLQAGAMALDERAVEAVAVVVLGQRAAETGLGAEHARWLAHFASPGPSIDPAQLDATQQRALAGCRQSNG